MVTSGTSGKCSRTSMARLYASWPVDAAADHIARLLPTVRGEHRRDDHVAQGVERVDVSEERRLVGRHRPRPPRRGAGGRRLGGRARARRPSRGPHLRATEPSRASTRYSLPRAEGDRALLVDQLADEVEVGARKPSLNGARTSRRRISGATPSSGTTASVRPASATAPGMLATTAVSASCAITEPPAARTASDPRSPS